MPALSTKTWRRWDLNIGDNLKMNEAERAFVEVRTGMTRTEIEAFEEAVRTSMSDGAEAAGEKLSRCFGLHSRLGVGFELDGKPIASLDDLIKAGLDESAFGIILDLAGGIRYWNSVMSSRELFSERLSGGDTGTKKG